MTTFNTEQEIKLPVSDIASILKKIRKVTSYSRTEYIRDVVYGRKEDKKKIRLRILDNFEFQSLDATNKYRVSVENGVKKEIEEIVYKGNCIDEALAIISLQGDFVEENSYEKIRVLFVDKTSSEITLDLYPFGCWIEIEGKPGEIHRIASNLGYSQGDYITVSADDLYLEWHKKHNLPEMWDVRFGLGGKK